MKTDNQIDNEFDEGFDEEIIIPEKKVSSTDSDFDAGFEEDVQLNSSGEPINKYSRKFTEEESRMRGIQQGATFGLADEASGRLQAILDYAARPFMETPAEVDEKLKAKGFTGDLVSGNEVYEKERDVQRELNKQAQAQNPGNYLVGEVIGGAIIPGAGVAKAGQKAATMATKAVSGANKTIQALAPTVANLGTMGAIGGGVTGLGMSEGETAGDVVRDTAQGAVIGAVGTNILGGLGKAAVNTAKGTTKTLSEFPTIQKIISATKAGFEKGKNLTGSAESIYQQEMADFSKDLSNRILERTRAVGKAGEKFLRESDGTIKLDSAKKELDSIRRRLELSNLSKEEVKSLSDTEDLLAQYIEGKEVTKLIPDADKIAKAEVKAQKAIEDLKAKRDAFVMKRENEAKNKTVESLKQKMARTKAASKNPESILAETPEVYTDPQTGKKVLTAEMKYGNPTTPEAANVTNMDDLASSLEQQERTKKLLQDFIPPNVTDVQVQTLEGGRKVAYYTDKATGNQYTKVLPDELDTTPLKAVKERMGGTMELTPAQATELKRQLKDLGSSSAGSSSATRAGQRITNDLNRQVETVVPEARKMDKMYSGYKTAEEMAGITGNESDIERTNKYIKLLESAVTSNSATARNTFNQFSKTLAKTDPALFKSMTPKLKQLQDELGIISITAGEGFSVLGQAGGKAASLGNMAGRAAKAVTDVAGDLGGRAAVDVASGVKKFTGEQLQGSIARLRSNGDKLSDDLANILESYGNKSDRAKNAIMFGLMQNPKYRNLLETLTPDALEPKDEEPVK